MREFRILRLLKHDNILEVYDLFTDAEKRAYLSTSDVFVVAEVLLTHFLCFRLLCTYKSVCIGFIVVWQLCETDLACILRSDQQLTDAHYKFFIYQVFHILVRDMIL